MDIDAAGPDPFYRDPATLKSERRPLIETKIEVRMDAHDQLPRFVTELARHLGAKDVKEGGWGS